MQKKGETTIEAREDQRERRMENEEDTRVDYKRCFSVGQRQGLRVWGFGVQGCGFRC